MLIEQEPYMSEEMMKKLREFYQDRVNFPDDKTALINGVDPLDITPVKRMAKDTGRVTTVGVYAPGEIAEVGGRKYQVQESGAWKRIS